MYVNILNCFFGFKHFKNNNLCLWLLCYPWFSKFCCTFWSVFMRIVECSRAYSCCTSLSFSVQTQMSTLSCKGRHSSSKTTYLEGWRVLRQSGGWRGSRVGRLTTRLTVMTRRRASTCRSWERGRWRQGGITLRPLSLNPRPSPPLSSPSRLSPCPSDTHSWSVTQWLITFV